MATSFKQYIAVTVAELKGDKKKSAILAVLVVVAAVVLLRVAITSGKGPSTASAAHMSSPQKAVKTQQSFGLSDMSDSEQAAGQARRLEYLKSLNGTIRRDLFRPDLSMFPLVKPAEDHVKVPVPVSVSAPLADEEELRRRVLASAGPLVLESTMVGATSIASINGVILRVGETISGFKVIQITSHNCTLKKDEILVILEIQR